MGLTSVHILGVFTGPTEGFAIGKLHAVEIDVAGFEKFEVLLGKVFADDTDQVHRREKAGGDGGKGRRTAKKIFMLFFLSFDVVEGNGTGDKDAHFL